MSETTLNVRASGFSFDKGPAAVTAILFVIVAVLIARAVDIHQAVLYGLGGLLGIALYHASFGFTGGWRRFSVEKLGRAMRAQLLMIGIAAAAFIPLLAIGAPLGTPIVGLWHRLVFRFWSVRSCSALACSLAADAGRGRCLRLAAAVRACC